MRGIAEVEHQVVLVAPAPLLAGLDRTHDRMLGVVEVLGGVRVLGVVATADVTALHAQPEVHPRVAHLQALLAAVGLAVDAMNMIEMTAPLHGALLFGLISHADASAPGNRRERISDEEY